VERVKEVSGDVQSGSLIRLCIDTCRCQRWLDWATDSVSAGSHLQALNSPPGQGALPKKCSLRTNPSLRRR